MPTESIRSIPNDRKIHLSGVRGNSPYILVLEEWNEPWSGGMGSLYRAWDSTNKRWVLIKTAWNPQDITESASRSIPNESSILDRLSRSPHRHVIQKLNEVKILGHLGIVVPFFPPPPYQTARYSIYPLQSVPQQMRIIHKIAGAIDYWTGLGIIHRDLHSRNILVGSGSMTPTKIVDFGIATTYNPWDSHFFFNQAGYQGTAPYEQVMGYPQDSRTDIAALGALTHLLLSGKQYGYIYNESTTQLECDLSGNQQLLDLRIHLGVLAQAIAASVAVNMDARPPTGRQFITSINFALPRNLQLAVT